MYNYTIYRIYCNKPYGCLCREQELTSRQDLEMSLLRKTMMERDEESRKRLSMLDAKLLELETLKSLPGEFFTVYHLYSSFY